jgi:PAS domain-containing protein
MKPRASCERRPAAAHIRPVRPTGRVTSELPQPAITMRSSSSSKGFETAPEYVVGITHDQEIAAQLGVPLLDPLPPDATKGRSRVRHRAPTAGSVTRPAPSAHGRGAICPRTPAVRRGLSAGQEWPPRVGPVVDEVLAHGGRAGSAARSRAARRLLIRLKRSLRVKRASTFENVAVGIAHVDRHLGMLRVNQAFCRIFGYSVVKTALPSLRTLASLARRHRVEEGRWHVSIRPLPRLDQGPQSRQHHVSAGARCRVVLEDSSCSDLIGPVAPQHVVCPCVWGAERRTRGGLLGFALGPVRPC